MVARPSKRLDYFSRRNNRKRDLSFPRFLFPMVVLLSVAYNVYQLPHSQKRTRRNISQSTESAVSGAVNDNQIRSNEGDHANIVNDKIFSKAKEKYQINNTTKFNGSFVNESEANYFDENERTEKPKTIFCKVDKKITTQDIQDYQKHHVTDLLMRGPFKAKLRNGFRKMNRLMFSQQNSNRKNIDHLFFEKNPILEKPKTICLKADKKKSTKKIKDDQKHNINDLLVSDIFKAKLSNGFQKINCRMSSEKRSMKKTIDHLRFEKNAIFTLFSEEKKRYSKYLSDMCLKGKQRKWAKNALKNLGFKKAARNCEESKMEPISAGKEDIKNDQYENSAVDTILYFGCGLIVFVIMSLNVLYFLMKSVKTRNSRLLFQNTLNHSRSSKTLLMALGLLLSYAPVNSDVTLSTQGTYFLNRAPGRYLKGYVHESSVVPSLFHCQMRCDTLHLTCKSLNYIENEDGSNSCEINHDAQYCALPGDFIVKENSFYVETMLEKDDAGLCSTCGYKGVIKKTKETPGFMCLCQEGVYGDKCQHDDLNSSPILNGKADYISQLSSWLPSSSTWRLCWRATQHGWAATTFHSQCDNKGPTVTIVRVGEFVFGGSADVSWTSQNVYVSSENAFLFSLKNKDDLKPFKAPVVYQNRRYALYHRSDYGPTFGGGHDMRISNNANSNTGSFTNFGHTYQPPPGYTYDAANTKALLAGSYYFTPSEVEVFYLQ